MSSPNFCLPLPCSPFFQLPFLCAGLWCFQISAGYLSPLAPKLAGFKLYKVAAPLEAAMAQSPSVFFPLS
ncbi:hypothetical protein O6P43_010026 [Quillaja saponaria]|uniref:Uncharacterized protein n=1 Tax=Quillaja saponaria TaxID=32244 RepID=A0AAD7VDX4_QUISA|nr:hypothetical protein O6P43_010026 [Quillaja saponaria]